MREHNLGRLNTFDIELGNSLYLHYHSYHKDLFLAFKKYVSGKLLDIGCGNKPYLEILKPLTTEYLGVDIIQSNSNCVDLVCAANHITLDDNSFDTIISTQTIEHVEDHQGLVNEAYRILKKDGYFIISGPMYWPLHEEPYDFFRFTKHGFTYILNKAGFEVISIASNGGKWALAGQAFLHAIYPAMFNVKGFKGKVIKFVANLLGGVKTINRIFLYLDKKNYDPVNTMNYVIVAKKP